jgi:VWFA-related protein
MNTAWRIFRTTFALLAVAGALSLGAQQLPDTPQPQNNVALPRPASAMPAPAPQTPSKSDAAPAPAAPAPGQPDAPSASAAPQPQVKPIAPADLPPDAAAGPREQLFSLTKQVTFVSVPVTVKDEAGHLVTGLTRNDFAVYEDGQRQNISFFTSDPFPLSVAVVLSTSIPNDQWNRIKDTLSALVGAFSQFDEVALYTYGNTVQRVQEFTTVSAEKLGQTMRVLKTRSGSGFGPPVVGGSMAGYPTPSVNGHGIDPTLPNGNVSTMPKESFVLNDAILAAAQDLARRDQQNRARNIPPTRKVLFIISDGRELGSSSSYADVLKVLLTRQISVYAVSVSSGIPGYGTAQRIRIPGFGYGDILPKYAAATGGQSYAESSPRSMEDAYSRITEEARNQYTIGYTTRPTPSSTFRRIEVRVHRARLKVYARDGYYPLPTGDTGPKR